MRKRLKPLMNKARVRLAGARRRAKESLSPRHIIVRTSLVCALLGAIVFGLALKKIDPLPLSSAPLHFEARRAHTWMSQLAKGYPYRTTWSDARKQAGEWLKAEFKTMGYTPRSQYFSEVIAGREYSDLENIYVERRGKRKPEEIIVVMAHYDVVDTTIEGAMDDASGVGVVMELARVFAKEDPDRTLLFMATDSEEYGAFWGARAFARSFDRSNQIVAALNFDFVVPGRQTGILTLCDGLKNGFTPLWLREIAINSLHSLGLGIDVLDFRNAMEFIERALQIPPADHGPLLSEGIPAFNWVGQTDNFPHVMAHYHHTKHDLADALEVASFDPFGRGAERVIRSIDELPKIPDDFRNPSYFKLSRHLYLDGWAVTFLHILCFIPFLAFSIARFGKVVRDRPRGMLLSVLGNEAKNAGILLGSFLLGYTVMLLLPALKVITQYEIFPATQKSPILFSPNFLAMLLVIGAIIVVYFLFKKIFAEPEDDLAHSEIRHAFHTAFMAIVIFLAFLKNSYLAILLLLLPAYLWTFIRYSRRAQSRVMNVALLLSGAITFVAMIFVMTTIFHIGAIYWYIFLSATYGLISAYTVVLAFMVFTVMIRIFRSIVS
jgi:hypothetical protein